MRLLLGFFGLFFLLELELAVVHDPAHGRISLLAYEHQVQFPFLRDRQRLFPVDHTQLGAVGIDHP